MFIQKNRVRISGKQTCPPNLLKCSTKPLGAILWRNPRQIPFEFTFKILEVYIDFATQPNGLYILSGNESSPHRFLAYMDRDDQQNEYREQSTRTFSTAKSAFSTSSMPSESCYKPHQEQREKQEVIAT